MSPQEFCLFLVSILTAVGGQFFLKIGALKLGRVSASNVLSHFLGILTTPQIVFGLMLYGISAILYILLLTRVKLSVAGPAVAMSYIFSVLLAYFFFQEPIPPNRIIGLGLIVTGVILVVWNK